MDYMKEGVISGKYGILVMMPLFLIGPLLSLYGKRKREICTIYGTVKAGRRS